MFSFIYTSGVCKRKKTMLSYRMGQKITLQTLVHIIHQIVMDFTYLYFTR